MASKIIPTANAKRCVLSVAYYCRSVVGLRPLLDQTAETRLLAPRRDESRCDMSLTVLTKNGKTAVARATVAAPERGRARRNRSGNAVP